MMSGDNTPMPGLELVSRTATLHAGDQVVSSGDGGLLPSGLPIGTVLSDGGDGWRVALLANPGASQDVEILNFSLPPEQAPAAVDVQLPAEAAGLKPLAPPPPKPVIAAKPPAASATKPTVPAVKPAIEPSAQPADPASEE
jgi:rod shape-determining protein MreC